MKTRTFRILLIAALLLPLSGCPAGAPAVTLGLWLITVVNPGSSSGISALEIQANGQTEKPDPLPPEATGGFASAPTWAQSGSTIVLDFSPAATVYTGTVHTSTVMSGTFGVPGEPPSGKWYAILL